MDFHIKPLSGTIGAEIHGIEIAKPISSEAIDCIRKAVLEYHVVFFPHQSPISPERHIEFGRCFGQLQLNYQSFSSRLEGHPEIVLFDGSKPNGRAGLWHTDITLAAKPPMGCIMYMKELPERGGDTMWADLCAAHDALSPKMQEILAGMTAVHDMFSVEYRTRPGGFDPRDVKEIDYSKVSKAEHPVVRVHPESGRRCLFINPLFTSHIVGLATEESHLLLSYLFTHMQQSEFICRRHWSKGDVAFWDNRCTMHRGVNDFGEGRRVVHRVCIEGDAPLGV